MRPLYLFHIFLLLLFILPVMAQDGQSRVDSFRVGDIKVTIDQPAVMRENRELIISFFALPNGNTTEQTMGKKMQQGDDWHFDIQHIAAQTRFIRQQLKRKDVVL